MKTLAIIKKEFRHIFRDARSLLIIIIMPMMMLFLYGYALNLDLKNIKLAIIDYDQTITSRDLISRFLNSGYFNRVATLDSMAAVEPLFKRRQAMAAIVIPTNFEAHLTAGQAAAIEILVDGSDANIGTIILSYADMIVTGFSASLLPDFVIPIEVRPTILFNPDLKSSYFFVPGLVAIILMMISALLTSITVTREKETGTLEQLLVTPINPLNILIGKVIPYIFLAFFDGALIIAIAHVWFHVPINGNLLNLALMMTIYISASLSIGLLISTIASTQQIAIMLALLLTMLPSIMLSGFIFPIASMPKIIQYVTLIVPARYFLTIIRGSMLKGLGISYFFHELAFLIGLGVVLLSIGLIKFKRQVG